MPKKYVSRLYPQSIYRRPKSDDKEGGRKFQELDTQLEKLPKLKESHQQSLVLRITGLIEKVVDAVLPEKRDLIIDKCLKKLLATLGIKALAKEVKESSDKKLDALWQDLELKISNSIKSYLLKSYTNEMLLAFATKIKGLVSKYSRHLPRHVADSETQDLTTIAQLEFLETFKVWDLEKSNDVWPLAYSRINGAMKDHIRYITKSDPTRFYDWIADAAHLYLDLKQGDSFEQKIENGVQLSRAMDILSIRERRVVVAHSKKDMTFQTIADDLDLSESQVSRIYKKAVEKIKKQVEL